MYSNALKQYRAFRRDETVVNTDDIKAALQNESISETERQELIKARVGQGQFRKKVLQKYGDHPKLCVNLRCGVE